MRNLEIEKTNSTPYVFFDAEKGHLQLIGESYPENVTKFYSPILEWIRSFLQEETIEMVIDFKITYFNSSSSKVFMLLFELLDEHAQEGRNISVKWICDEDNDIAVECGEEFKEDLEFLSFIIEIC